MKEKGFHAGKHSEYDSYLIDEASEDKLCDELESVMCSGGVVLEHHSSDFFPERWFDLVLVLRTDNTVLYDRLAKRGYSGAKITENVECEIMEVCLGEARDSYREEVVIELPSNTTEDMDSNAARCEAWVAQWKREHADGVESGAAAAAGGAGGGSGGSSGGAGR